jgi:hypothetical protein
MNYAKRSLLKGGKVIHAILQPEIRTGSWTILGKTYYRTLSPTHVVILTDRELIIVREDERRSGDDKYGGIWDYIPLPRILSLSLSRRDGQWLALSVQLPGSVQLECVFLASAEREVNQLLGRYGELTGGAASRRPEPERSIE